MSKVAVIGAGMAGLSAAARLSERGYQVTLIERGRKVGGKLGVHEGRHGLYHEHCYHMYLNWYNNFWQFVSELGLMDQFEPREHLRYLRKDGFPNTVAIKNVGAMPSSVENLFAGVLPVADMFLYGYSLIDIISTPVDRADFLDLFSVNGFMRSREYSTDLAAIQHQRTLAKAFALPSFRTSAESYRKFIDFGFRCPSPMLWALRGNVYDTLLVPFEQLLIRQSCTIMKETEVVAFNTQGSSIKSLTVKDHSRDDSHELVFDHVISTVPAEALATLVTEKVYEVAPELGGVRRLNSQAIGSLDLVFNRKLPNIPKDHVVCVESKYDLTFIDNSQLWPNEPNTFLNVAASDFETLHGFAEQEVTRYILQELRQYIPFEPEDIDWERTFMLTQNISPLFLNEVGNWADRPVVSCGIDNLFIAGDFCRSPIDVVTIEGAIYTGLVAAEEVRRRVGQGKPIRAVVPETYPKAVSATLRAAMRPAAQVAKVAALGRQNFFDNLDFGLRDQ